MPSLSSTLHDIADEPPRLIDDERGEIPRRLFPAVLLATSTERLLRHTTPINMFASSTSHIFEGEYEHNPTGEQSVNDKEAICGINKAHTMLLRSFLTYARTMAYTDQVVDLLATLTLFGGIIVLVLLGGLLTGKQITRSAFPAMLIVAATATMGSLFLSEIAGWVPCKLCWFQRIFMYPQVPILLVAFWKRDRGIAPYLLFLCLIGAVFSTVHYTEQLSAMFWPDPVDPLKPCDASGVSCAATPIFRYGYITIPMMALTAFFMNALIALGIMRAQRNCENQSKKTAG